MKGISRQHLAHRLSFEPTRSSQARQRIGSRKFRRPAPAAPAVSSISRGLACTRVSRSKKLSIASQPMAELDGCGQTFFDLASAIPYVTEVI